MNLKASTLPNHIKLLKLDGSLDIVGVRQIETHFSAHCNGDSAQVLVDLSGTVFVTSLGIRMLLQAIKSVSARKGQILLLNPVSAVASALEISGLGQFVMHGTEAEAVGRLTQTSQ